MLFSCFLRNHCKNHRCESTNVGAVDTALIEKEISVTTKKEREAYKWWTPDYRFKIGKYAAENGNTAAVCKFKAEFPGLNESTVREFKKKYNIKITSTAKEKREMSKYWSQSIHPSVVDHHY